MNKISICSAILLSLSSVSASAAPDCAPAANKIITTLFGQDFHHDQNNYAMICLTELNASSTPGNLVYNVIVCRATGEPEPSDFYTVTLNQDCALQSLSVDNESQAVYR